MILHQRIKNNITNGNDVTSLKRHQVFVLIISLTIKLNEK
jgi:hypothetical protein